MNLLSMYGLVYTEMLNTSHAGCGLVGHILISLSGILPSQTLIGEIRSARECVCGQGDGMTYHASQIFITFASMVGKAAFTNLRK